MPSGNKPLPEPVLTQISVTICVTGPQWVKLYFMNFISFRCLWGFSSLRISEYCIRGIASWEIGNEALPEPMISKIYNATSLVSPGHNELIVVTLFICLILFRTKMIVEWNQKCTPHFPWLIWYAYYICQPHRMGCWQQLNTIFQHWFR